MSNSTKNTRVKAPQRPMATPPVKPQIPRFQIFQKPMLGNPRFSNRPQNLGNTAFRNQNRGSGGK